MRLRKARVHKYRSIRDSGLFEIEKDKTILVGPNEAGKTVLLQALQQLNAPEGIAGFDPLRDYPRSEYNDITTGRVDPSKVTVVEGHFELEDADRAAIPDDFRGCVYVFGRKLDNKWWHRLEGGPKPSYGDVKKELTRLCAHIDARVPSGEGESNGTDKPSVQLSTIVQEWNDETTLDSGRAGQLSTWLEQIRPLVDEENSTEKKRYERLVVTIGNGLRRAEALQTLHGRVPTFVLFNNYFRVRALIHLEHLAQRIETGILDDEEYDYGNKCLLRLLGFTARELADLGNPAEPAMENPDALRKYRAQLDQRSYQLNAASIRLTSEIRSAWLPDPSKGSEADRLRVRADRQYLKVVVEDDLGVEIELDQRSEGYQWLVSFFVVFFVEAADKHENAVLLLDEPGLSLHGLKQRDFRKTISRLAERNQTLYTTHSPFLVGPGELELVRVVEMISRETGTKVHTTVTADDPASLLPLQEALGYDLAQSLFAQQRNLVLEGLTDYWYLDATAELLRDSGMADLNQKIALVPAASAGKVVYFATILHAHKLKIAALLDSDAAGERAAQQEVLVHRLGNKAILRTKDVYSGAVTKPEIEDLLRETLLQVAKDGLGWDVASVASAQSGRPITDIFKKEIPDFSKYRLAKAYLRWARDHDVGDLVPAEVTQWVSLIDNINKALK